MFNSQYTSSALTEARISSDTMDPSLNTNTEPMIGIGEDAFRSPPDLQIYNDMLTGHYTSGE
jgi:hypothetical protein